MGSRVSSYACWVGNNISNTVQFIVADESPTPDDMKATILNTKDAATSTIK
jgi:hypothetical protein